MGGGGGRRQQWGKKKNGKNERNKKKNDKNERNNKRSERVVVATAKASAVDVDGGFFCRSIAKTLTTDDQARLFPNPSISLISGLSFDDASEE